MSRHKNRKAILAAGAVILALLAVAVIAYSLEGQMSDSGTEKDDYQGRGQKWEEDWTGEVLALGENNYRVMDRCETFLFVGTDFSGNEDAEGEDYEGSMADFLVLYIVNHTDHSYTILPIDRNTMMDVPMLNRAAKPTDTYFEQICTSHWYGSSKQESIDNTVACVSRYLGGLTIDAYYFISMSQIQAINHALGGVTVTLEDDFTTSDPSMKKGETLTLSDKQAEIFIRSRMNMEDDANSKRMSRQRTYFKAALKQVRGELKKDPNYIDNLYDSFREVSDSTITGRQLSQATNAFISYKDLGVQEIQGETRLGETFQDGEQHQEFYPDSKSLTDIMTGLYQLEPEEE